MNCQNAQDLIVIGIYGRLTPFQKEELQAHLQTCTHCTLKYQQAAPLMDLRSEISHIPEPDLKRSWTVISDQVLGRRRFFTRFPMRKWALAVCSLLAVFVLGYFAGKQVLSPRSARFSLPAEASATYSFSSYANSLKPVLIDFLNRDGVGTPDTLRLLEKQVINDMLIRTHLLKSLAAGSEDLILLELLQDLELVLISMDNLDPEDRDSTEHLASLIREKKISLRLHEYSSAQSTL